MASRTRSAALLLAGLLASGAVRAQTTPSADAPDSVSSLLTESARRLAEGDYEGAVRDASTALVLDPKNAAAYEARGSIYIQEKLWDRAERDYNDAYKITPDPVYKYKLGEIKFLQKSYEDAEPRFAALKGDPHLGELAAYKAFLCDLIGGHDDAVTRDLAERDQAPEGPARYYCHAAYFLYHNQRPEASACFATASQLYGESTRDLYLGSLMETRRFQLETLSFTTRDGTNYTNVAVFLESAGLRVSTAKGYMTVPIDQLPDDLSAFPEALRQQINLKRAEQGATAAPTTIVSFTSQSGQAYDHVRWALTDTGLSVLTPDGWTRIPFQDLPTDLSAFPPELRQAITGKRAAPDADAPPEPETVSFTTHQGKAYAGVKAVPGPEGIRVLTPDGWIVVAYPDLPDDVSSFPADWQKMIADKRRAPEASSLHDPAVVSFATRQGKTFTDAHVELGIEGVRVLTPDGWVIVGYRDLPQDTSAFPAAWQPELTARRVQAEHDTPATEVISFTTQRGIHYDQVRAALEKTGLRVVTPDGLVAVPFSQLPTDLSPFPEAWRETITTRAKETPKGQAEAP